MPNTPTLSPTRFLPRRSREDLASLKAERDAWLADIAPAGHFHQLFDELPGVFFFAKDIEGRTMLASRGVLQRYGMKEETEMLGLTDFDINPYGMAQGYVKDDARNVSLREIAHDCGQSLRSLQRHFQSAFGLSPQEFLIKTRVLAAMKLLQETALTAAEIARQCGFADSSSFAEQFKQRTGMTPLGYRNRC